LGEPATTVSFYGGNTAGPVFTNFGEELFFKGYLRLLKAVKPPVSTMQKERGVT